MVVAVDGKAVDRVPLAATASASAATLVERYDAAVPGPRLVAWVIAVAALAAAFIGLILAWDRRGRFSRERP